MTLLHFTTYYQWGFHGDSDGKESACNVGDLDLIPELGRSPGGGHGNPLQYSCMENPCGQRSLAGYIQSMGSQRVGHNWATKHNTSVARSRQEPRSSTNSSVLSKLQPSSTIYKSAQAFLSLSIQ